MKSIRSRSRVSHRRLMAKFFCGLLTALVVFSKAALADPAPPVVHYLANLSGPAESPPNASPATGVVLVDYDSTAHLMRVQAFFGGLLGSTTASHIHSATATPGTLTAGVATTTPSFAGFPLGVTAGTSDVTLDMTQASSYNPAFVTANGGTTASAEAALAAGMAAGEAYYDIHTTVVPGGEIRGFLTPIVPPNHAPAGSNNTITINEDTPYTFAANDFGFSDPNDAPPNNFNRVMITTLPAAGTLTYNGAPVQAGDFASVLPVAGGATWTARDSFRSWYGVASSADGAKLVAVVNGGQIYTSTDSGTNWTARDSNRGWQSVASSADGVKLVAAVDGGQIYTSTDSGTNWTARESTRSWLSVASSADGAKLVAVVNGGQIYTSTDSGTNWTARESVRNWEGVASSADGTKLVAVVYAFGQIYTSTDSGTNWTARASGQDWTCVASSADGSKLVAGTDGAGGTGPIYTSTDGGTNWTAGNIYKFWGSVASSADGTKLVAVSSQSQIYTSTDGGTNWTARDSRRNWAGVASSADGTKLVAGTDNGQIYTSVGPVPPLVYIGATNANGSPYATFTFQVGDDGGTTNGGVDLDPTPRTMTINVIHVDGAPTGANNTVTLNEDTNYTFAAGDFGFVDSDAPANNFDHLKITTLPAAGTLTYNGNAVNAGDIVSIGVSPALVFTPATNANGLPYASFTFQVGDDGGTANGGVDLDLVPRTMTINVTSVNDAPTGANNTVTLNVDTNYLFAVGDFGFSDPNDAPPDNFNRVRITTLPAAGTLTFNGNAVNAGDTVSTVLSAAGTNWTAQSGSGGLNWTALASSADGNKLVAGTLGGQIYTSTNFGGTWTARDSSRQWQAVASSADGSKLVAVVLGGSIYTSTNSGATWTARAFNGSWHAVASSADGSKLVAGTISGGPGNHRLYTSVDSGVNWTQRIVSTQSWWGMASSADGSKLVALDNGGQIYTSVNSGANWTATESNRNWSSVASSADGSKLVAVVNPGQIYTSTDSGTNWTARESSRSWQSVASSADGSRLVAVGGDTSIYTSTDSGTNWTAHFIGSDISNWSCVASSANGSKVAAGAPGESIYTSFGLPPPLVFTPATHGNGSPYTSFTFQVGDDGGTANGGVDLDPTPRTMTINVNPFPAIIGSQSGSLTTNAGTTVVFNAGASGSPPLYYFWSKNGVLLSDNAKFSGSGTTNLTIANLLRADAGTYQLVVSNAANTASSAPIVLGVIDPVINTQPQDAIIGTGTNQIFSVGATGTPDLHYQWYFASSTNRPAAKMRNQTNSTLNLGPAATRMAGSYFVIITNQLSAPNSVTSRVAQLTVFAPAVIKSQPGNYIKVAGNNVTFSVRAVGAADLHYQWYENGGLLDGQTNRLLSLTNVQEFGTNYYSCTVSNEFGMSTSSTNLPSVHGRLIVKQDTNSPSVSINYPTANARLTNGMIYTNSGFALQTPLFALIGGVHDNGLITSVTIEQLFPISQQQQQTGDSKGTVSASGIPVPAHITQTAPGTVRFTNLLFLADGTNTFAVTARDYAGNHRTVIRSFFHVHFSQLTVELDGNGNGSTLSVGSTNFGVATNGGTLEINRAYTIKAVPGPNSIFTNWTDLSDNVLTNGPQYKFIMTPQLVLHANFPTNPIVAAHVDGSFNGLFHETNGVGQPDVQMRSAGFVHLTVKTNRTFSGNVVLEGHSFSFADSFDPQGDKTFTIKRATRGLSNLMATLHLDWDGGSKRITGTVTNSDPANQWSADLVADLANQYSTAARLTAKIAPGVTGPQGYGYGLITNDATGMFNLVGKVADGSAISQVVPISKDGDVPLYVKLYGSAGLLTGKLNVSGGALTGNVTWIKPAGVTTVATYPEGFTNTVALNGTTFVAPVAPATALRNTNLVLTLSDSEGFSTNHNGGALSWNLQLRGTNFVVVLAGSAPNMVTTAKVNANTGLLNFTYKTAAGASKSLVGVVDQVNTNGVGYLIGKTNVGSFTLHP